MSAGALRRSWVEQIMGLPISLLARGDAAHSPAAQDAATAVYDELRAVDLLFSPFKEDSEVSRVRRGEIDLTGCSPDVRDVAERCLAMRDLTAGAFDAEGPQGWDPSGLVKGWAAERAVRHLAAVPGADWVLNAGGDVAVHSPSGEPFVVGIEDPQERGGLVATVSVQAGGVATSGTAARGAHLYDPRGRGGRGGTKFPWLAVTVAGPSLELADVLATAAFVSGTDWQLVLAAAPGYEALAVDRHGHVQRTRGWTGRLPA